MHGKAIKSSESRTNIEWWRKPLTEMGIAGHYFWMVQRNKSCKYMVKIKRNIFIKSKAMVTIFSGSHRATNWASVPPNWPWHIDAKGKKCG